MPSASHTCDQYAYAPCSWGSEGEGWHSHSEKGHPQSTSTPGLCHKHPESDINDTIPHVKSTRKSQMLDKKNEDYWQWDGKETLIRIHKTPRRQNFVPQDCKDFPGVLSLSSIACIVEICLLSEQPEVVWVGLVSVLRFRSHQYRYSVKNLTACRQLVRRHVQRKKIRYRCYPVLSSVRSAATRS